MENTPRGADTCCALFEIFHRGYLDGDTSGIATVRQWCVFLCADREKFVRNIATAVGISKGAAVRAIDALAAEGLVEREMNAADRRSPFIRVTAKGARVIASVRKRLDAILGRQMDNRR